MTYRSTNLAEHPPVPQARPVYVAPQKSRRWMWIAAASLMVLIVGIWWYTHSKSSETAAAKAGQGPRAIPVVAAVAKKGDLPVYIDALANVVPLNMVTLQSRVDGEIQEIAFTEGQLVHAGDFLAQIDPRPSMVQLEQAKGQEAKDQAALKDAELQLERDREAGGALSKQQVDTQQATVDELAAALKSDQAAIDSANLQLTYCRITSPITGRIGLRLVDKGNIVHASDQTGLAVITQLQPISVTFSISQDQLPPVIQQPNHGVGLPAEAWDRALKNKIATGVLAAIDNQIDRGTATVKLKAQFENKDETLYPSQLVNIRLLVNTIKSAVIVPAAAVQRGPEANSTFVYVVKPDETVDVQNVTTGITEGDQTVITDGVAAGTTVVTDGVDKLEPHTKVAVRQGGFGNGGGRKSTTAPSTEPPKQTNPATQASS